MRIIIFILNFIFILQPNSIQQKHYDCFYNINSDDFNLLIETKDVILIDVRTFDEYKKERIPNTLFAPDKINLLNIVETLDTVDLILLYCEEGDRSIQAANIICENTNIKYIYNLEKGIIDWKKKGYPIDKKRIRKQ